jgi:hypothetical protein
MRNYEMDAGEKDDEDPDLSPHRDAAIIRSGPACVKEIRL